GQLAFGARSAGSAGTGPRTPTRLDRDSVARAQPPGRTVHQPAGEPVHTHRRGSGDPLSADKIAGSNKTGRNTGVSTAERLFPCRNCSEAMKALPAGAFHEVELWMAITTIAFGASFGPPRCTAGRVTQVPVREGRVNGTVFPN